MIEYRRLLSKLLLSLNISYYSCIVCLIWYCIILFIAFNGFYQIVKNFAFQKKINKKVDYNHLETSNFDEKIDHEECEGVLIIRPIIGFDFELIKCLESSFKQNYDPGKLEIIFCLESFDEYTVNELKKLFLKYPKTEGKILFNQIEESFNSYNTNPKINNLSKGFVESKYDIVWILDSNVWSHKNLLKNSVKALNGNYYNKSFTLKKNRNTKLIHHIPLALKIDDVFDSENYKNEKYKHLIGKRKNLSFDDCVKEGRRKNIFINFFLSFNFIYKFFNCDFWNNIGNRLDEMFLLSSHAKFYVSLNTLFSVPCVNGKSNIYRKSDLDTAVSLIPKNCNSFKFFNDDIDIKDAQYYSSLGSGNSLKFFSRYIGEDNMIGICFWQNLNGRSTLMYDTVVQPLKQTHNNLNNYLSRRIRWLRVRKYMVMLVTFLEPTTESIFCGIIGTCGISRIFFNKFWENKVFLFHILFWFITDYIQYWTLFYSTINNFDRDVIKSWLDTRKFNQRSFLSWSFIWILREILAFPIWIFALSGSTIIWRGRKFILNHDLSSNEIVL